MELHCFCSKPSIQCVLASLSICAYYTYMYNINAPMTEEDTMATDDWMLQQMLYVNQRVEGQYFSINLLLKSEL